MLRLAVGIWSAGYRAVQGNPSDMQGTHWVPLLSCSQVFFHLRYHLLQFVGAFFRNLLLTFPWLVLKYPLDPLEKRNLALFQQQITLSSGHASSVCYWDLHLTIIPLWTYDSKMPLHETHETPNFGLNFREKNTCCRLKILTQPLSLIIQRDL